MMEESGYKFANLLKDVEKIQGIERIRFISPHPKDFTDDVIDVIKNSKKICKILHLPLQSGSTKVLERMNRKYTKEQYLKLADNIKKEIPEVVFSTDIIVRFSRRDRRRVWRHTRCSQKDEIWASIHVHIFKKNWNVSRQNAKPNTRRNKTQKIWKTKKISRRPDTRKQQKIYRDKTKNNSRRKKQNQSQNANTEDVKQIK